MARPLEFSPDMTAEEIIAILTRQPEPRKNDNGFDGDDVDRRLAEQIRQRAASGDAYNRRTGGDGKGDGSSGGGGGGGRPSFVTEQAPASDDILEIQDFAADVAALDASVAEDMPVSYNEQTRNYAVIDAGIDTDSEDDILAAALETPDRDSRPRPPTPVDLAHALIERPGQFPASPAEDRNGLSGPSAGQGAALGEVTFNWSVSSMKAASMAAQGIPTQRIVEILLRTDETATVQKVLNWKRNAIFSHRVELIREQMRRQVLDYLNGNAVMVGRQLLAIIRSGTKNDDVKLRGIKLFFDVTGISWSTLQKEAEQKQASVSSLSGLINYIDADYQDVTKARGDTDAAWVGREVGAEAVAVAVETWGDARLEDARLLNQKIRTPEDVGEGIAAIGRESERRSAHPQPTQPTQPTQPEPPDEPAWLNAQTLADPGDAYFRAAERVIEEMADGNLDVIDRLTPIDVDSDVFIESPENGTEITPGDVLVRTFEGLDPNDSLALYAKNLLQDAKWTVIKRLDPDFEAGYQEKLLSRREQKQKTAGFAPRTLLIAR